MLAAGDKLARQGTGLEAALSEWRTAVAQEYLPFRSTAFLVTGLVVRSKGCDHPVASSYQARIISSRVNYSRSIG